MKKQANGKKYNSTETNVSVAMAVYNGEKYLSEQLESILQQLSHNDELVISYDISEDKTLEILLDYSKRHANIKIVSDPGKGVFSNFENAINECSKEYVFISDQDDIWMPDKIEHIKGVFSETNADMVIHNGVQIDSYGNTISDDFFTQYKIKRGKIRNFVIPRYSGCCTAFNKRMKNMIVPIPRDVGAYDHWIGMIGECFGKTVFDDTILIKHRLHGNNVTVSRRKLSVIIKARFNLMRALFERRENQKQ